MTPDAQDTDATQGATTDVLTPEQRRLVMSRIRSKDTKPEMLMRHGLHARGLRYRLHSRGMPGKPDMMFAKYRAVVLVHGCFWHGHGCSLFKWPKTRAVFWKGKIDGNMERDRRALTALNASGWRVLVVWECALKGSQKRNLPDVLDEADAFIRESEKTFAEIAEYENIEKRAS